MEFFQELCRIPINRIPRYSRVHIGSWYPDQVEALTRLTRWGLLLGSGDSLEKLLCHETQGGKKTWLARSGWHVNMNGAQHDPSSMSCAALPGCLLGLTHASGAGLALWGLNIWFAREVCRGCSNAFRCKKPHLC